MKEIRIFLASSYELEPDRARIGDLIRQLNEVYEEQFIHLHLVKWEDLNSFYTPEGKQFEYDSHIEECELFIGLFWHGVGRHTKHEVVIARAHLPAENILIFRKTAEYQKDHEGSEDQKRYIERHPDEDLKLHQKEFDSFLDEQKSIPYKNYGELRQLLSEKIKRFSETIEITEEEKVNRYSSRVLQIHVAASPEAESDLVRLGDLVRYLDENNKFYSRVRLIPEIPGSDMFVALCHTAAPEPVPQEIRSALKRSSDNGGKPRIYFCMKYVAEKAKEKSLKELETRLSEVLKHYPDRYTQSSEMKLHFLLQLENLKRGFEKITLTVENGVICQKVGENKVPLMSCEDMLSLQKDTAYQELKKDREFFLTKIEDLTKRDQTSEENLSGDIYQLSQELMNIQQQIIDKQNDNLRLARFLDERVGKEQCEEIIQVRKLIGKGAIEAALILLPDSHTQREQRENRKKRHQIENLRAYEVCQLTIICLTTSNLRKNRDEICDLYELQIDIAANDLNDREKTAAACNSYALCLTKLCCYDRAQKYYEEALTICKQLHGNDHPSTVYCFNNLANIYYLTGKESKALDIYEENLKHWIAVWDENILFALAVNYCGRLGQVFFLAKNNQKALQYGAKANLMCKSFLRGCTPLEDDDDFIVVDGFCMEHKSRLRKYARQMSFSSFSSVKLDQFNIQLESLSEDFMVNNQKLIIQKILDLSPEIIDETYGRLVVFPSGNDLEDRDKDEIAVGGKFHPTSSPFSWWEFSGQQMDFYPGVSCGGILCEETDNQTTPLDFSIDLNENDVIQKKGELDGYEVAIDFADDPNEIADLYLKIAEIHRELGDFAESRRDCKMALQILRDNFGDDSPAVGKTERFIQEIREKLGEDPADQ